MNFCFRFPLVCIDIVGSLGMIVLAALCLHQVVILSRQDRENPLNTYLFWLVAALFVLCLFRSVGHILKHLLLYTWHQDLWATIAPWSGGLNSAMFIVIFAVTLFFRDVLIFMNRMTSDRARIESTSKQLLSLNQEIETVVSDRTKVEMALNLAHEIRNPVMIISGLLRRLRRKNAENTGGSNGEYHHEIQQQINQLEGLVDRFEKMQQQARQAFSPIELKKLLAEAIENVRPEAESKGIKLVFSAQAAAGCHGNEGYLLSAFLHLLRNSIEACRSGSIIELRSSQVASGTVITLHDNGPGINAQVVSHVFEPFYSTRDGATGMGLSYVRQIIHEHHGKITLASVVGKGTTVEVFLPSHLDLLIEGKNSG